MHVSCNFSQSFIPGSLNIASLPDGNRIPVWANAVVSSIIDQRLFIDKFAL